MGLIRCRECHLPRYFEETSSHRKTTYLKIELGTRNHWNKTKRYIIQFRLFFEAICLVTVFVQLESAYHTVYPKKVPDQLLVCPTSEGSECFQIDFKRVKVILLINLVLFITFRCPLFPKPVNGQLLLLDTNTMKIKVKQFHSTQTQEPRKI